MDIREHYDIVIVGGGLVGASLALALRNSGLSIAILEAKAKNTRGNTGFIPKESQTVARRASLEQRSISDVVSEQHREDAQQAPFLKDEVYISRSIALSYTSRQFFENLGIWHSLTEYITPIQAVHVSDKGHFGCTRITAEELGFEALGYSVPIESLLKSFEEKLKAFPNIDVLAPAQLVNLNLLTQEITVEVNNNAPVKIKTHLLIAADGQRSTVCQLLNIKTRYFSRNHYAFVANIELDRPHHFIAHERFTDQGPIALLPLQGDQLVLVWTTTHEEVQLLANHSDETLLAKLHERFGYRIGRFIAVKHRFGIYPLNASLALEQIREGVVVLGNAAHTLHPVGAQGFNLSLRDVTQLAEIILKVLKEENKTTIGKLEHLKKYLALRHTDQTFTFQFTQSLIAIFTHDTVLFTPFRSWTLSLLNYIPALKKIIVKRTMGL